MTASELELATALETVVEALRTHLAAVRASSGVVEDAAVAKAYAALSRASFAYDDLLLEVYGEATPWDVAPPMDPALDESRARLAEEGATDPYSSVVSVRQRRDYHVVSVSALLAAGAAARRASLPGAAEADDPVESVSEAVLELLQAGDGSLTALDVPELEPLDGLVVVVETDDELDPDEFDDGDGVGPFAITAPARLVGRLSEHAEDEFDDDDDDDDLEDFDMDDFDDEAEDETDEADDETGAVSKAAE